MARTHAYVGAYSPSAPPPSRPHIAYERKKRKKKRETERKAISIMLNHRIDAKKTKVG